MIPLIEQKCRKITPRSKSTLVEKLRRQSEFKYRRLSENRKSKITNISKYDFLEKYFQLHLNFREAGMFLLCYKCVANDDDDSSLSSVGFEIFHFR